MSLDSFGWNEGLQRQLEQLRATDPDTPLIPARVIVEHRGAYDLMCPDGPRNAELTGKLRHEARDRRDLPAVGDWVVLAADGRIDTILPRKSAFIRKVAGLRIEPQVIAANVDVVFIVTSANADFNPRRIERYVAAVTEGRALPVLVLNKTDLGMDVDALLASLGGALSGLAVARVSALERRGLEQISAHVRPGTTIALVGSSGVGKSTIVNWLLDRQAQLIGEIREHDAHGRHTTTHRELIPLPGGAALIDTPGIRELALWSEDTDLGEAFEDIEALAKSCRFADCQHQGQPGCAVQHAMQTGALEPHRLEHYGKLQREIAHQRDRASPAARQAIKQNGKALSRAQRAMKRGPGGKLP
jgi:ribosome biogenesis GTPase / thiamine phosphate phosphatase